MHWMDLIACDRGGGIVFDEPGDASIEFRDLPTEKVDHRFASRGDLLLPGTVAVQFLGRAHLDQLPAMTQEIREARTSGTHWDGDRQRQRGYP